MSKVNNEEFIVIQGWMINELLLKGNELLIYAIIYRFTNLDEGQTFTGGLQYLANWTNSTKQGVIKSLNGLMDKGLIEKNSFNIMGVNKVEYYTTKFNGVLNKVEWGGKQSLTREENKNRIENNLEKEIYKEKESIKRFEAPTLEEVRLYCLERKNNIDPEQFIDFYTSKGWKVGNSPMKDWKACIRTWEKKDRDRNISLQPTKNSKNNPPLDENGNIDLSCGGTFRGTII